MLQISCLACDHKVPVDGPLESVLRQKLNLGFEAPETEFSAALEREKHRFRCSACRDRGATVEGCVDRDCVLCGVPIPWQRLEAVPDTRFCVPCLEAAEASAGRDAEENLGKCPRCGSPLKTYQRKKPGTTSYFVGCSGYPSCRYKPR